MVNFSIIYVSDLYYCPCDWMFECDYVCITLMYVLHVSVFV